MTEGSLFHLPWKVAKQSLDTLDGPRAVYNYLRRRLWWQLLTLVDHSDDFGVEGIAPSVCTDEKLPLNVNDCELEFAGAAAGEEHGGVTESSFCLMQYETTKTFNRIRSERSLTPAGRNLVADRAENRLHATRDAIEAKYFRYSSGESPISRFTAHIIAIILAKRRLLLHISPPYNQHSHSPPPRTCDLLFLLGIHMLELSRTVQKARCFERWRWLGASYFQWSAATFVARARRTSTKPRNEEGLACCQRIAGRLARSDALLGQSRCAESPDYPCNPEQRCGQYLEHGHAIRAGRSEPVWLAIRDSARECVGRKEEGGEPN